MKRYPRVRINSWFCDATGEGCEGPSHLGKAIPDCYNCEAYEEWKKKRNTPEAKR